MSRIHEIRGSKVMLDMHLAELYGVETKQLKRQVRRNLDRFPKDFMFQLAPAEWSDLRSQIGTSSWGGVRYAPMAFTEHGVLMLANVLSSKQAVATSIRIIRVFSKLREMVMAHKDLLLEFQRIRAEVTDHGKQLELIFRYLQKLEDGASSSTTARPRVGYRRKDEN